MNESNKEKILKILKNDIKNVNDNLVPQIIEIFEGQDELYKKDILKIIKNYFNLSSSNLSIRTIGYWELRGWSKEDAKIKVKIYNKDKPKRLSPFSYKFWLSKINPKTNKFYSMDEAIYKANSIRPIKKEYWMNLNYSEEEAQVLAKKQKDKNNKKGALGSINRQHKNIRKQSHRCKEYWMFRGYTEEESINKIKKLQANFSLSKCIEKYGDKSGHEIWSNRQIKWLNSLKSSGIYSGYSKISKELFDSLSKEFPNEKFFYADNEQIVKTDKLSISVDFLFEKESKIIEFNGDYWHANPKKYNKNSKMKGGVLAETIWEFDKTRNDELLKSGYEVLIIWESDYRNNKKGTIKKCINFLNK